MESLLPCKNHFFFVVFLNESFFKYAIFSNIGVFGQYSIVIFIGLISYSTSLQWICHIWFLKILLLLEILM